MFLIYKYIYFFEFKKNHLGRGSKAYADNAVKARGGVLGKL